MLKFLLTMSGNTRFFPPTNSIPMGILFNQGESAGQRCCCQIVLTDGFSVTLLILLFSILQLLLLLIVNPLFCSIFELLLELCEPVVVVVLLFGALLFIQGMRFTIGLVFLRLRGLVTFLSFEVNATCFFVFIELVDVLSSSNSLLFSCVFIRIVSSFNWNCC